MSESDLPIYDPLTFYQQLLSEERSRVNACPPPANNTYWGSSLWRWTPAMGVRACAAGFLPAASTDWACLQA